MVLLGLVLPALLVSGRTRPVDAAYLLQWVVVEHAAVGLAAVLASARLRPMQLGFWAFAYLWMGVAPLAMLAVDSFPLSVRYPADVAFVTSAIIEVGLVAYSAGTALATSSAATRPGGLLAGREFDRARVAVLAVVALGIGVVLIPKLGGLASFFGSRQSANTAVDSVEAAASGKAQKALVAWGVSVPAFWALLALLRLPRGERRTRIVLGVGTVLLVLLLGLNVVVNNPISQPRFWSGTVLLAVLFTSRRLRRPRVFRAAAAAFVLLLLVIFPYADYFRYAKRDGLAVQSLGGQLVGNPDYDAYQMMETGVQYARDTGLHTAFALGPPLFAVPRAVWPGKPEDVGVVLARYAGYDYTNRSSPLWIESYLWGGVLVVALLFLLLGVLERRLDDLFDRHRGGDRTLVQLIVPVLAFYQLIVLRGPLLQATAPLALLVLTPLLASRRARAPAVGAVPAGADGNLRTPAGTNVYPGHAAKRDRARGQGGVTDRPVGGGEEREGGSLAARLDVLRRRRLWVAGPLLVGLVLALVYATTVAPSYTASAEVVVRTVSADPFQAGGVDVSKQVSMPTEQQIASSGPIAERVRQALRVPTSSDGLLRQLRVSVAGSSQVLRFQVTRGDAGSAAALANAFATAYLQDRRERTQKTVSNIDRSLSAQLKTLEARRAQNPPGTGQSTTTPQQQILNDQIITLQSRRATLATLDTTPGDITQPADVPGAPSGPSLLVLTLLGGFLGLVAGLVLAQVRESADSRIRNLGEVGRAVGAPVLTSVPIPLRRARAGTRRRRIDPGSGEAEAYRIAAVRLQRVAARLEARTILVVSARHGEGRTTVTANLAHALVEMGRTVVAVSADWRRPALDRLFADADAPDLTSLIASEPAARIDALIAEHWQRQTAAAPGRLLVVPSGDDLGSPAAMATAPGLRAALSLWRNSADVVLVDSPPALSYSDALALVPLVDAVLVVADANRTRHRDLEQLAELLDTLEVPVVGAVVVRSGRLVRRVRSRPDRSWDADLHADPQRAVPGRTGTAPPARAEAAGGSTAAGDQGSRGVGRRRGGAGQAAGPPAAGADREPWFHRARAGRLTPAAADDRTETIEVDVAELLRSGRRQPTSSGPDGSFDEEKTQKLAVLTDRDGPPDVGRRGPSSNRSGRPDRPDRPGTTESS